jgi:hypothetical protein
VDAALHMALGRSRSPELCGGGADGAEVEVQYFGEECGGGNVRWTAMLTPQPAPAARASNRVCRWDLQTEGKTEEWFQKHLPGECGVTPAAVALPTRYCTGHEYWYAPLPCNQLG